MADDPDNAVFGDWAGCPRQAADAAEPVVGGVVSDMGWINQGDQHVHIEQVGHGNSSRKVLTSSGVTMTPFSRTGRSGIPLRSARSAGGRSERRARSET